MDESTELHSLELAVRQAMEDLPASPGHATPDHTHLLNGAAEEAVRAVKSRDWRRTNGVYFTPQGIADQLVSTLNLSSERAVVLDPAAGAGDLLLATLRSTRFTSLTLRAVELQPDLAALCDARLELAAALAAGVDIQAETVVADGLSATGSADGVTHIVMNPPFTTGPSCDRPWGSGRGSHAADFVWHYANLAAPGVDIAALLPDVLRSGSRYERWRRGIDGLLDVREVKPLGRFSREADVDVFLLRARRRAAEPAAASSGSWWLSSAGSHRHGSQRIRDFFSVRVGAVVDYRSPRTGAWRPFLRASDLQGLTTRDTPLPKRRFSGWVAHSPFVAVPRTSSFGEAPRARAVVVPRGGPYAVENHVLVLSPNDGQVETCMQLASLLRSDVATDWLDQRIRCRHLTKGAIAEMPFSPGSAT